HPARLTEVMPEANSAVAQPNAALEMRLFFMVRSLRRNDIRMSCKRYRTSWNSDVSERALVRIAFAPGKCHSAFRPQFDRGFRPGHTTPVPKKYSRDDSEIPGECSIFMA